jgi:hypothetical protein
MGRRHEIGSPFGASFILDIDRHNHIASEPVHDRSYFAPSISLGRCQALPPSIPSALSAGIFGPKIFGQLRDWTGTNFAGLIFLSICAVIGAVIMLA